MTDKNEAFSRILIDEELKYSGWNLLDPHQVRFEYHVHSGRADYLLMDRNGGVLCVLEAKKENLDPYDAKEQARGYAENLKAPFVILSNGAVRGEDRGVVPEYAVQGVCGGTLIHLLGNKVGASHKFTPTSTSYYYFFNR